MKRTIVPCLVAGVLSGLVLAYTDAWIVAAQLGSGTVAEALRHTAQLLVPYLLAGACVGLIVAGCLAAVQSFIARRWQRDRAGRWVEGVPLVAAGAVILRLHIQAGAFVHTGQPGLEALIVAVLLCVAGWMSVRERLKPGDVPVLAGVIGALGAWAAFCPLSRLLAMPGRPLSVRLAGQALAAVVSAIAGYLLFRLAAGVAQAIRRRGVRPKGAYAALAIIAAVALGIGVPRFLSAPGSDRKGPPFTVPAPKAGRPEAVSAPNVILISVDTLRHDFLGCNGGRARTPNIDALAAESHVFETAYSVAPWTRPSFAAFHSGRYPSEMGVGRTPDRGGDGASIVPYEWRTDPVLLAEAFQEAGYFAAAVVTNPHLTPKAHADQGFDFFLNCEVDPPDGDRPQQIEFATPTLQPLGGLLRPFRPRSETGSPWDADPCQTERAEYVTSSADELVGQLPEGPALLWFHYMDPHHPYDPPTIPEEEQVYLDHKQIKAGGALQLATEREMCVRAYASEIEYFDRTFADLVDALKQAGLWESSIVVFWSDHGEEFWDHGGWEHGCSLFDELLRVPLMVRLPGQRVGVRQARPASLLDVMPTLLDLCHLKAPPDLRGRSLAPLLQGRDEAAPPFRTFVEGRCRGGMEKGLITPQHKLIYRVYEDTFCLYDLSKDPSEEHNIHGTPLAPDTTTWETELRDWSTAMVAEARSDERTSSPETDPEIRDSLRDLGYAQ